MVVANGMESEPASEKDQALLARAPHLVLDGAVLAAEAVGAATVHVCLDRDRPGQVEERAGRRVEERRVAGLDSAPILVHDLPGRYVSSEETALISWLNGGEARPTTCRPGPFERGVQRAADPGGQRRDARACRADRALRAGLVPRGRPPTRRAPCW